VGEKKGLQEKEEDGRRKRTTRYCAARRSSRASPRLARALRVTKRKEDKVRKKLGDEKKFIIR
jgi:hypothetical protein